MWLFLLDLLAAGIGYGLGSIPTGYLVARRCGIDIRQHGSGNIGATNVLRVLGRKIGYFVFACDALKGLLAVRLAMVVAQALTSVPQADSQITAAGIIAAVACILGHNFPVWLRFKGGKGVATTVGALLGLMPLALLISAVVWIALFYTLRYVSLASLVAAAVLPVSVWLLSGQPGLKTGNWPLFIFSLVAVALIFWRHRANIGRLLNGTEARFAPRATSPPPPAPPL